MERNITETFDRMKTCLIEMKKAVESDMDLRDENFTDNMAQYTQSSAHYKGLRVLSSHVFNMIKGLMQLHRVGMTNKTTTGEYDTQYGGIQKMLETLQRDHNKWKNLEAKALATQSIEPQGSDPIDEDS